MRHLTVLLLAVVVLAGCAGTKVADTTAHQSTIAAQRQMHQIAIDHNELAAKYAKGCNASARTIPVVDCNKWSDFDNQFRVVYRQVGNDILNGSNVDPAVAQLRSDLNQFMR